MLWAIEIPEQPSDAYQLVDDLPSPNLSVLKSMAMGDVSATIEEAARLDDELGLNNPVADRPELAEMFERLVNIRPDWDWREPINPETCSQDLPLSEINQTGIYNRAVVLPGKRSPFTKGLEVELKKLADTGESIVRPTALGSWLSGNIHGEFARDQQPLIEVIPMNSEQRAAVQSALSSEHTVVTGPPGTGKSQVVTNLLVNAAWRGMKVLFASKNNKAVDVVEARVNGLGNRPVLLRLGSGDYQAKLANYLVAMLAGNVSHDDELSYQEGLLRFRDLEAKLANLERLQEQTLQARNLVDRLEDKVEPYRQIFGVQRFNELSDVVLSTSEPAFQELQAALDALDPTKQRFFGRFKMRFAYAALMAHVVRSVKALDPLLAHIECPAPETGATPDLSRLTGFMVKCRSKFEAAKEVVVYQKALEQLRQGEAFEKIASIRKTISEEVASNSAKLWTDWVQLAPSRLTQGQRRDLADYTALLQVITGQNAERINQQVRNQARVLQTRVSKLFSCWAVTSLAAKGKLPFEAAHFDLVVIDEASQCDIASALPLLFRAKRSVIIGDPMQLRHISALPNHKDTELLLKHGLVETRPAWMYSVKSLFDLAAGVADHSQIINLRDHHRSHADIIEFSNHHFYDGKLRVATRYDRLKRPRGQNVGVIWQDVPGHTIRPGTSSAQNQIEAEAVIGALYDLLVTRHYEGTVGVVTPFHAQKQLIQKMIAQSEQLSNAALRSELLVDTVHGFQGDERDVILFSPVVSEGMTDGAIRFLRNNGNLFNVAITRARGLLHVVGDRGAALASGIEYLIKFATYVETMGVPQMTPIEQQTSGIGPDYPVVAHPERVSDWEKFFYRELSKANVRPMPITQFSVEQYDLDLAFFVGDRKLNVEIDGERYHRKWTGELCLRDQLRSLRLIELGWEVKRFWVYEIRDRLPDCIKDVQEWIATAGSAIDKANLQAIQAPRELASEKLANRAANNRKHDDEYPTEEQIEEMWAALETGNDDAVLSVLRKRKRERDCTDAGHVEDRPVGE